MKAAALLNLPVQTGRLRVVDLHSVDAEVVLSRDRILGVDERQRDERPAVFLPRRQHRQLIEPRWSIDNLRYRRAARVRRSEFKEVERHGAILPQFARTRRQYRLRDVHHLAHQRFRLRTECKIQTPISTEHVRNDGISASLHPLEQQRGTAFGDHTPMNLRKLEIRIDLSFDSDDFVFSGE